MASLNEIFKKINKGRREEDKVGILGDTKIERTFMSTGSIFIDRLAGGGFACGGVNLIVASGGVGKSSMALLACKDAISKGKVCLYWDAERTLDESYFSRMGINKDKLIYRTGRNLEEMLDEVEAFSTADEVGCIVLDSIPIFTSTAVIDKSADQNSIGNEAKRYTTRLPIIEGNCANRGICLICLTSYKLNPMAMGDPRVIPRGEIWKTISNTILDMTKKEIIVDKNSGLAIGHVVDCRIKKTKTGPYDPKKAFKVNFYYDGGFNQYEEYVRLFLETGVINQAGAWIKFFDSDGVEQSLQGKDTMADYLAANKPCFDRLIGVLESEFDVNKLDGDVIEDSFEVEQV